MQKGSELSVVIAGRSLRLSAEGLDRLARDQVPEPIRDHFVIAAGKRFPPKQLIAIATGIDRADFTTNQARAILRRLGFATGRARSAESRPARVGEATVPYRSTDADALRPHVGKWVALFGGEVLVAASSPEEVLGWLRRNARTGDALFRVPLDPSIDLGGFQ